VQQVINKVMVDGKKSLAEQIVYEALGLLSQRKRPGAGHRARGVGQGAHARASRFRSRRSAARPTRCPSRSRRGERPHPRGPLAHEFARNRREKTMAERLAGELLDAQNQQGGAFKRKDDIYRMAQANKAFAHYRW
jgi:small subunit ribosomal protein S7